MTLGFFPGLVSERVPPVPIPNTVVKPFSADGTARVTVWESRSTPGILLPVRVRPDGYFFPGEAPEQMLKSMVIRPPIPSAQ